MKLRSYKFIRLITACVIFTLALGPLAANAGIVMQCPHMPFSAPVTCADMRMAIPSPAVNNDRSNLPPCCRHQAHQLVASNAPGNVVTQSVGSSCVIVTTPGSEAIGQSVVPSRAEALTSSSTTALPDDPNCSVLGTNVSTSHSFLVHSVALPLIHIARIHGSRAPPVS